MEREILLDTAESDEDLRAFDAILADCFATSTEEGEITRWRDRIPAEDRRVVRAGGEVVGTLVQVPMGQWFGGRSVRTMGVAGVGVAPVARGGGFARRMLGLALQEWRAAGFSLSTLYPSTYALYRAAGYERAGTRHTVTVRLAELDVREASMRAIPLRAEDAQLVRRLQAAHARANSGHLDRGPYVWRRIEDPKDGVAEGVLFVPRSESNEGSAEGYARFLRLKTEGSPYRISVTDVVCSTARAARAFFAFLGTFRTVCDEASWSSAPNDPLLACLPERRYQLRQVDQWMVRVLDPHVALRERGYPCSVRAELHLRVEDEQCPGNSGCLILSIADGAAQTEAGGAGRLAVDARGLAALYTGQLSPAQLGRTGRLSGPEADLDAATGVFAGSAPWMPDFF